jgi:hypothetical protein
MAQCHKGSGGTEAEKHHGNAREPKDCGQAILIVVDRHASLPCR